MNLSFFIVSCMLNTFNKSKYEFPFHLKSINRNSRMWLFLYSESDCFGDEESNSFFSHDLPILEMEACQSCQNN